MNNLIFLDIDGTIRDFDGYIPQSAINSIIKARENGNKVFISTGRVFCQIEKRIMDIGFDGVISGSGSYITYMDKCVAHKVFSNLILFELMNFLLEKECVVEFQNYKESFILESQKKQFEEIGKKTQLKLGKNAKSLTKPPKIISSISEINEIEKIMFFSNSISSQYIKAKWQNLLYVVPLSIDTSQKFAGEITPVNVNKGEAIKIITKSFINEYEKIIAIGDSENDIEMIEMADIGVAMGNGSESVKNVANFVTTTLKEDGLKNAFEYLKLI